MKVSSIQVLLLHLMVLLCVFSRLDDVQSRLKETSDEFESVRRKARKAKIDFETIQKERYDLLCEHALFFPALIS